jgi:hypothetical protein
MVEPIIHELEYDDDVNCTTLGAVDVTHHYAVLLKGATEEEIELFEESEDRFLEALRDVFEADATLLDGNDSTRPWTAYGVDLRQDLSKSLGIDDEDLPIAELVAGWLEDESQTLVVDRHRTRIASAIDKAIADMRTTYGLDEDSGLLAAAFSTLMETPNAFEALRSAIERSGPADPSGALRASAALQDRAS